jgi:hypothetical protein
MGGSHNIEISSSIIPENTGLNKLMRFNYNRFVTDKGWA